MGKIQWLLGWTSGINDNSKWAIFGKQNSKWAIFGIHKGYIGSIHKYLWYKIIRNTDPMGRSPKAAAPLGCRRRRHLCFWLFCIINIYGYSLYIPYMFHKYFLDIFHIISLVCFFIYSVHRRQILIRLKINEGGGRAVPQGDDKEF